MKSTCFLEPVKLKATSRSFCWATAVLLAGRLPHYLEHSKGKRLTRLSFWRYVVPSCCFNTVADLITKRAAPDEEVPCLKMMMMMTFKMQLYVLYEIDKQREEAVFGVLKAGTTYVDVIRISGRTSEPSSASAVTSDPNIFLYVWTVVCLLWVWTCAKNKKITWWFCYDVTTLRRSPGTEMNRVHLKMERFVLISAVKGRSYGGPMTWVE